MLSVTDAKELILKYARSFGVEQVHIAYLDGRVLAENIVADRDYPPFNRSAMDGYAINFTDFEAGTRDFEIVEEIYAGSESKKQIKKGQCYKIMTGAAVPPAANAVIRVEDSVQNETKVHFEWVQVKKNQNIAQQGEDYLNGQLVLEAGQFCTPMLLGVLASLGKEVVSVQKLPSISLISTGNEIIPIHQPPTSVQIRNSNAHAIAAFLEKYKIPLHYQRLVRDDKIALKEALQQALNQQVTIISGGVSAGDADFVPEILLSLGVVKVFHKVQLKPGKPLWFGVYEGNKVVFALPGNPVSVQVAFKIFIEPFLRRSFGLPDLSIFILPLLTEKKKKGKFDEFFPCKIANQPHSGLVPVIFNGSGDISATIDSDGLAFHAASSETLLPNDHCEFVFWHSF